MHRHKSKLTVQTKTKTKKELRNEEEKKKFESNYQLLLTKSFVIEANTVNGHEVYSNENFFEVNGDSAFLQVSPMKGITPHGIYGVYICRKNNGLQVNQG